MNPEQKDLALANSLDTSMSKQRRDSLAKKSIESESETKGKRKQPIQSKGKVTLGGVTEIIEPPVELAPPAPIPENEHPRSSIGDISSTVNRSDSGGDLKENAPVDGVSAPTQQSSLVTSAVGLTAATTTPAPILHSALSIKSAASAVDPILCPDVRNLFIRVLFTGIKFLFLQHGLL